MNQTYRPICRRLASLTAIAAATVVPMAAAAAPAQAQPIVPKLVIQKSHAPSTFEQGGAGQYSITVTNIGPTSTIDAAVVVDALPTGLTLPTTLPAGCTALTSTIVECNIAAGLAAGSTSAVTFTIPVMVAADAPAAVLNTVEVLDAVTGLTLDSATDLTIIKGKDDDHDGRHQH